MRLALSEETNSRLHRRTLVGLIFLPASPANFCAIYPTGFDFRRDFVKRLFTLNYRDVICFGGEFRLTQRDPLMLGAIAKCVSEISEIKSLDDLTRLFLGKIEAIGFNQVAYAQVARQFRRVPIETGWRLKRMKPEWQRLYDERRYFEDDPVIEEAIRSGAPFRMSEIVGRGNLSQRQREFIEDMKAAAIDDFLAFPVSSRPGEVACFYFAFNAGAASVRAEQISEMESICLVVHARYGALVSAPDDMSLSPRETEVMELIAKGQTNRAIGDSLGITANTVDTLVRRCFAKFGVTTRVEAVLAAISRGLILP